jgi:hypothetical protein
MSQHGHGRLWALLLLCLVSSGCGLTVPDIKEAWDQDIPGDPDIRKDKPPISGTTQIEFEIRRKIYCELRDAVQDVNQYYYWSSETPTSPKTKHVMIPNDWVAQLSLSLEVDESSALNPGITYNQVMANAIKTFGVGNTVTSAQSFNLGFGATLSSTATRTDKFDPVYSVAFLMRPKQSYDMCQPQNDLFNLIGVTPASSSPFLIESDLGIDKWLMGAIFVERNLPSQPPVVKQQKKPKPGEKGTGAGGAKGGGAGAGVGMAGGAGAGDKGGSGGSLGPFAVSTELKFVILSSGNVNPSWKLVQVSENTGSSPLFGVNRTRTHDLIISVGPDQSSAQSAALPLTIGNAVSNGVRSGVTSGAISGF